MPEMNGFDLVERIHADRHLTQACVLMLTSGEHLGDLARCRELAVSAYLIKPVRRAELRAAVLGALADHHGNARPALAVAPPGGPADGSGIHVLLCEDNPVNQRVAQAILQKAGHRIEIAANGREALRLLEQQAFDLVLMDVQMPEMDGLEATAAIRQREVRTGAHIPIVAMTAHAMQGDQQRCLEAGMDAYISKPIHGETLLRLVAEFGATQTVSQR